MEFIKVTWRYTGLGSNKIWAGGEKKALFKGQKKCVPM